MGGGGKVGVVFAKGVPGTVRERKTGAREGEGIKRNGISGAFYALESFRGRRGEATKKKGGDRGVDVTLHPRLNRARAKGRA